MRGPRHGNGRPHLAGAKNTNPLRKIVGTFEGSDGVLLERLECGHAQPPRSDMIGQTNAARRRCWRCARAVIVSGDKIVDAIEAAPFTRNAKGGG